MSALSFRQQYAPLILSGQKDQTIRVPRKRPIRVGQTLHLFTGMRTKRCKRIGTAVCSETFPLYVCYGLGTCGSTRGGPLTVEQRDDLARRDGFSGWLVLMDVLRDMHPGWESFDVIRWTNFVPAIDAS